MLTITTLFFYHALIVSFPFLLHCSLCPQNDATKEVQRRKALSVANVPSPTAVSSYALFAIAGRALVEAVIAVVAAK